MQDCEKDIGAEEGSKVGDWILNWIGHLSYERLEMCGRVWDVYVW